ncbi:CLUMA_CG008744, isoform A [Clunio marinus]|uniref:CLUMA_CG008744, isoform A n=1 Tax=Clunio marinus TaxID=568069 RepID=A0A1J1I8K4_9DIPT|nr:CLUMA_CG008744, isoform A [Clunio marinus]
MTYKECLKTHSKLFPTISCHVLIEEEEIEKSVALQSNKTSPISFPFFHPFFPLCLEGVRLRNVRFIKSQWTIWLRRKGSPALKSFARPQIQEAQP